MRKAKFILVALVAVVAVGIAFAINGAVPQLNQNGYLYNPATDQYITSSAVMGFEGVQFTISETKDCGDSFGSDDAKIEEAGYTYVRFKLNGTSDFMRMTANGVVCTSSGYHKWAVKETKNGMVIRCIYTSTQSSGALSPFAQQGYYLTPDADGKLILVEEPTEASYWEYVDAETYQERLENEANAAEALPKIIKKAQQILDKPMSNLAKQNLENALATYGEGYTGKAFPAALALAEAYDEAAASVVAYKGILSSYEMHKAMLMGDADALADFEALVADIIEDLENGDISGNGMEEMADIAKSFSIVKGNESEGFAYETECEVKQDYVPGGNHGITIDWEAIAEELGVEKDGLKVYAVMPDGTLDESYERGSKGTDGWRDAEGNWAGWNSADNLFYVQFTGLDLVGVGCMRTAEPTTYTATFKVVSAAEPEGKSVTLTISLNVKAKQIDDTVPTSVDELTIVGTVKQVVTLPIGAGYGAGDGTSANVDAILAALGVESFDGVKIFAVESDGSLDAEYKLGSTDGWRNADGDWAGWGDAASQFYVKADFSRATAQLYEVGCHPDHSGAHLDDVVNYTAQYAFVVGGKNENTSVLYNVVVAVAPEASDLDVTGATVQYFYNVEAKGFILGANNWNTRASIGAKGYQMHFEAGNEGAYKLCASNQTGTTYAANDLDYDGNGDIWVDGTGRAGSGYWTYTVNADKTFTIASTYEPAKGLLSIVPSKDASRLYMSEAPEAQSTWIAVSEQVYNAYSNKAVLKEEAATLAEIKDFIESTNFYTMQAYETYYQMYEDAIAKNAAGEVVGNLDNPNKVHGWHAGNAYDDFLLSAWSINGQQASEFNTSLYINTWSVEADGKEESSGMHVPFFEYWTGDDNSLGSAFIEGTITDLLPGTYAVSALVRVRIKNNGGDTANGITFSANNVEPVDVSNGRTCGDGDQFRWTFALLNGITVGDDGVLKVTFNVADNNNISWLSFKNVKYMKAATPIVTEPATAINEVNATPAAAKTIFNAAGQQLKSLQKGLNIVNGKKVLR